jgi:hypothetical protein
MIQVIIMKNANLTGVNRLQDMSRNLLRLKDELQRAVNRCGHLRHGENVHHQEAAGPLARFLLEAGVDFVKGQVDFEGSLH